jgi:hypothetical protein
MGNLNTKLEDYFKLSLIMTKLGNLNAMFVGYFELCFTMAKVDNLHANLEYYFELFSCQQMWVIYNIEKNSGL